MLFPHIQIYNEQNPELFHDSDTSENIQKDSNTSYDNSKFDDIVFGDDPFSINIDDKLFLFDNELQKFETLDDINCHPS